MQCQQIEINNITVLILHNITKILHTKCSSKAPDSSPLISPKLVNFTNKSNLESKIFIIPFSVLKNRKTGLRFLWTSWPSSDPDDHAHRATAWACRPILSRLRTSTTWTHLKFLPWVARPHSCIRPTSAIRTAAYSREPHAYTLTHAACPIGHCPISRPQAKCMHVHAIFSLLLFYFPIPLSI